MAHLWQSTGSGWAPLPLHRSGWSLACGCEPAPVDGPDRSDLASDPVLLAAAHAMLVRGAGGARDWALLTGADGLVRVNGQPVPLGLRLLADRDEIVLAEGGETMRWFFSTEQLARVESFPGSEATTRCPRCKQTVEREMPAVRCPDCGAWHHQVPEGHEKHRRRECWTYGERCAICPQPTALDSGYRWTPEGL